MHKSRLGGLIIDCNTANLRVAETFWTQALGYEVLNSSDPDDDNYVPLKTGPDDLAIELQKVSHPSRVENDKDRRSLCNRVVRS